MLHFLSVCKYNLASKFNLSISGFFLSFTPTKTQNTLFSPLFSTTIKTSLQCQFHRCYGSQLSCAIEILR